MVNEDEQVKVNIGLDTYSFLDRILILVNPDLAAKIKEEKHYNFYESVGRTVDKKLILGV